MLPLSFALVALLQAVPATQEPVVAARNPAYAHDGRLAVSVRGDLWVVSTHGEWTRLTSGPAWDREPSWSPDGGSIVFSSDRSGKFEIYKLQVSTGGGNAAEPE